jgi:thiamine transport system ATP-binding protein
MAAMREGSLWRDGGGVGEAPLLAVRDLRIERPDGAAVLAGASLELRAGEIVALLGPSGAGKSTLLAALAEPERLRARGFTVRWEDRRQTATVGVVPQRGALFDHLDVAGNLRLALRNATPERPAHAEAVAEWLERLRLPGEWARRRVPVGRLSGGEAQRVAIARTLAGGQRILLLDEPSVGLDAHGVAGLAGLLRETARDGAAVVVVTHDLSFAAAVADRSVYFDRAGGCLRELGGAADEVLERLAAESPPADGADRKARRGRHLLLPFAVPALALRHAPAALGRRARDLLDVLPVVAKQALARPSLFFAVVSVLVGFSVLYVFHRAFTTGSLPLRDAQVLRLVGARHIIALAPPLSGILFAATSANALTAWLGGLSLTKQTTALRALGIPEQRYLWLPAWAGLVLASLLLAALFVAGMVAGSTIYVAGIGQPGAFDLVAGPLLDPTAADRRLIARAVLLMTLYAFGIATDAVAKGAVDKHAAEDVTASMVRSVMTCTIWIVGLELLTLPLVLG